MATLTGGCACGAVRYESTADPLASLNCYCRDCQRSTGSAMASILVVPQAGFKFTKGNAKFHTVTADSGRTVSRGFCAECGSPLMSQGSGGGWVAIKAGSLDDTAQFKPAASLYTSSAPPWALFHEGPKFEKSPS